MRSDHKCRSYSKLLNSCILIVLWKETPQNPHHPRKAWLFYCSAVKSKLISGWPVDQSPIKTY
jgi:hypothetical protein